MIVLNLVQEEFIALKFPYNQEIIASIRKLDNRKWNPDEKQWEVHIAHLPELMKIFYLPPSDIPPEIMTLYQKKWISSPFQISAGNLFSTLKGKSYPMEKIDELTSYAIQGSEFNPRYIEGTWDGKKHLFNKRTHSFPTGLLPRIINFLKKEQINFKLADKRVKPEPSLEITPHSVKLRDYQELVIQKALKHNRGIIEMATGSGKTLVAAHLIARLKVPTLFFVHSKELLYQSIEVFQETLKTDIGQIGDGQINIHPITVATIQTVIRALGEKYQFFDEEDQDDTTQVDIHKEAILRAVESAQLVIFDECHHLPAESCYTVAMHTENAFYRFGLSATPYRSDRQDMLIESALGPKIIKINASTLIEQKYLVPPVIQYLNIASCQPIENKDYACIYNFHIVHNPQRNQLIARKCREYAQKGLSTLVLVQQIKHGEELLKFLSEAKFLRGNDTSVTRNKILKEFKENKLKILIATTLADEGLDIPILGCLILAGGGKSETRALQRVGRALRPAPNKHEAVIIDFLDNVPYLREHSLKRIQIFNTEPHFKILQDSNP
jgi:superfamily II DNA or RNA helicase